MSNITEKQRNEDLRGAYSGALSGESGFRDAVAAVMRLPLTEEEKADAIRRLLVQ